ncbi:hypothetical protein BC833DRAFT_573835 [Globomyces pollinis-pini]|nr:hypothetical protein BC833DRAFT_573835 [Globomyces pollinis-pini]
MVGISRVFKHQTDSLYADTNHVLLNFKKSLFSIQQSDVDMPVTEARLDVITLESDLNLTLKYSDHVFKVPQPRVLYLLVIELP